MDEAAMKLQEDFKKLEKRFNPPLSDAEKEVVKKLLFFGLPEHWIVTVIEDMRIEAAKTLTDARELSAILYAFVEQMKIEEKKRTPQEDLLFSLHDEDFFSAIKSLKEGVTVVTVTSVAVAKAKLRNAELSKTTHDSGSKGSKLQ